MSKPIKISAQLLTATKAFLDKEEFVGQIAPEEDLHPLLDGSWLENSAVIPQIIKRKSAWDVCLVFAHHKDPLHLIVRHVTRCLSEEKAEASAAYIRKEIAKDRRGKLRVSESDLNLCSN